MEEIINLKSVDKIFYTQKDKFFALGRKKIELFSNLNLSFKRGEIVGLLGPNGAGKTTILKLIATILLPNKGKILVNGTDSMEDPIPVRKIVSLVSSEERSFYYRLTGFQNLLFFAALCDIKKNEAKKRIDSISSFLKLDQHIDKRYQEYSTGLKQKLTLARGLLRDFQILLLDEPIKSIDAKTSGEIMTFIKDKLVRQEGKTVILTTHNMKEIEPFADRFVILDKGALAADFGRNKLSGTDLETLYKRAVS